MITKCDKTSAYRLALSQDIHFFYTGSDLCALQNCASIFSAHFFGLLSRLNNARQNLVIELCRALKKLHKLFTYKATRSFVAIEL